MPPSYRVESDFAQPISAYQADPSPINAGAMLKAINPVISMGVKTYGGGDSPLVRSRARRIALDAMQSYDPARASVRTHLMPHLQGLQRYAARVSQTVSVPERVAIDHQRLHVAHKELSDELGREPSDLELADRARLSRKRIGYVRNYNSAIPTGVLQQQMQALGDPEGGAFDPGVQQTDRTTDYARMIYHDLDPRDQVILERTLGLDGHKPLAANKIARLLGISPSAVTQRARRIQQQLDALTDAELI